MDKLRQKGQTTPGDLTDDASPPSECSICALTGRHEGFILTGKISILLQAETSCRMPLSSHPGMGLFIVPSRDKRRGMNPSRKEGNESGDSGGLPALLFEKHVYELRFSLEA